MPGALFDPPPVPPIAHTWIKAIATTASALYVVNDTVASTISRPR
jgi:hypothetical protein